jgi:hypothetical protein
MPQARIGGKCTHGAAVEVKVDVDAGAADGGGGAGRSSGGEGRSKRKERGEHKGQGVDARRFESADPWVSYASQSEAARQLGLKTSGGISDCVNGRRRQASGYEFRKGDGKQGVVAYAGGGGADNGGDGGNASVSSSGGGGGGGPNTAGSNNNRWGYGVPRRIGDRVLAQRGTDVDEAWFSGTVVAVNDAAGTCDVQYADGDTETGKPWARVRGRRAAVYHDRQLSTVVGKRSRAAAGTGRHSAAKPKPPTTAYQCFMADKDARAAIEEANTEASKREVLTLMTAHWKTLNDSGREPFVAMAKDRRSGGSSSSSSSSSSSGGAGGGTDGNDGGTVQVLGGQEGKRKLLSFTAARERVRKFKLKSEKEWRLWSKSGQRPANIPGCPGKVYKDLGWISWPDWLGNGRTAHYIMLRFATARKKVHKLNLTSTREWQAWSRTTARPHNIPAGPNNTYRDDGWVSWPDWLGYGKGQPQRAVGRMLPFLPARAYVHSLGLVNEDQWRVWRKSGKRPSNIPSGPAETYGNDGWVSTADWLGYGPRGREEDGGTAAYTLREGVLIPRNAKAKTKAKAYLVQKAKTKAKTTAAKKRSISGISSSGGSSSGGSSSGGSSSGISSSGGSSSSSSSSTKGEQQHQKKKKKQRKKLKATAEEAVTGKNAVGSVAGDEVSEEAAALLMQLMG